MPNPQAAIPLPPHPDLEQYRTLAKDLVKACKSGEPDAILAWADRWMASLARALGRVRSHRDEERADRKAAEIERLAVRILKSGARSCVLADAQLVIARCHGFESWPRLVAHIDRLAHAGSDVADFEAAARLRDDREDVARLHDVCRRRVARDGSANGVCAVGGRNTRRHAFGRLDRHGEVGAVRAAIDTCHLRQVELACACFGDGQANGRGEAAEYLAERGARLGLVEAAGVGRLDVVKTFFDESGSAKPGVTRHNVQEAFLYAVGWGREDVVRFLLDRRVDLAEPKGGQTALHWAAMGAHVEMIKLLIERGAPLEAKNEYGGTVLGQALWSAAHGGDPDDFVPVIETLIAAGAKLGARHPPINEKVDALLARHGSVADPERYWFGEGPRKKKS